MSGGSSRKTRASRIVQSTMAAFLGGVFSLVISLPWTLVSWSIVGQFIPHPRTTRHVAFYALLLVPVGIVFALAARTSSETRRSPVVAAFLGAAVFAWLVVSFGQFWFRTTT